MAHGSAAVLPRLAAVSYRSARNNATSGSSPGCATARSNAGRCRSNATRRMLSNLLIRSPSVTTLPTQQNQQHRYLQATAPLMPWCMLETEKGVLGQWTGILRKICSTDRKKTPRAWRCHAIKRKALLASLEETTIVAAARKARVGGENSIRRWLVRTGAKHHTSALPGGHAGPRFARAA